MHYLLIQNFKVASFFVSFFCGKKGKASRGLSDTKNRLEHAKGRKTSLYHSSDKPT
jgi:hypothetical protein